jgi:hypothetical protein
MLFVPVDIAETTAKLTRSALPNAPQIPDPEPRPSVVRPDIRARTGRLLRAMARHELRLADRLDPRCESSM